MSNYIDGFAFPILEIHLDEYKHVAEKVAEIWKEYGAISYNEFIGDDLLLEGTKSFIETLDAADGEVIESDCLQQAVNDCDRFDVRQDRLGANRVKVALIEFAVTALLRVFATPDRRDVIALEWGPQNSDVLGCESSQRHRQIKSHPNIATTVVFETEHLTIGFVAAFSRQDFSVLKRRRVDRCESE